MHLLFDRWQFEPCRCSVALFKKWSSSGRLIDKDQPALSEEEPRQLTPGESLNPGDLFDEMADGTAKKRDPEKWAREMKAKARKKMGGHSARAMQLAVKYYKDMGGTYSGKKSPITSSGKWSKEDWQTREEYESGQEKLMNLSSPMRMAGTALRDIVMPDGVLRGRQ